MDSLLKHIEVNAMAPASEKRKACCKVDRQGARKHGLNLSPNLGCGHTFIREGRRLVCRSPGGAGCDQEGSGTWPFVVGGGRGASGPDLPGRQTLRFSEGSRVHQVGSFGWNREAGTTLVPSCLRSKISCMLLLHDLRFHSVVPGK